MSEAKTKKVSANFQINTDSDLYRNIIEPKSSARCLSEFVHDLLDIYNSNSEIRTLIDAKIEEKNPLNQIKEQVLRVNNEHQKTIMSANILSGFVDFKGSDIFGSSNVDMANDVVNSAEIFEADGVLENLKMLLPSSVQDEIKASIEKRVFTLEAKVEQILSSIATKGNVPLLQNSGASKVSQLVTNLESMYDVDSGVISEEVSIPQRKEVVSNQPTVGVSVDEPVIVLGDENTYATTPKNTNNVNSGVVIESEKPVEATKPKAFGKLMGGLKTN